MNVNLIFLCLNCLLKCCDFMSWFNIFVNLERVNKASVCVSVSSRCVHDGQEFSEGEVYRMDQCWMCQCRGGISFCSKAECAELDCDNFYVPEGECCPVCKGLTLSLHYTPELHTLHINSSQLILFYQHLTATLQ